MINAMMRRSVLGFIFISAMVPVLAGPVPRADAAQNRCCQGSVCALRSAKRCAAQGGVNIGPGKCTADSCAGVTTTTTTTVPTTTTTVTTTTTTVPTTTTTVTTTTTTSTTSSTTTTTTTTSTSITPTITIPLSTTTTSATSTTTSTTVPGCSCAGGTPTTQSNTTTVGSGICGHLDADGNPNFFQLACGGLYFGGAGVGVPLPTTVPDNGLSISNVSCAGTALTLTGTTPAEAGGNTCSGGSNHHNSCTTNADCPGGTCSFLHCTNAGCLFGPPLPVPNGSHASAATSTCVINSVTANGSGTGDCAAGTTTAYNLPLNAAIFLVGDLMAARCSGGTTPGANCTGGGGCGTTVACAGGGTCVNDTGRCTDNGAACCSDADCSLTASCETGACVGGTNDGKGCIIDADCPGTGAMCRTFIQPCPICDPTGNKCNGGPNDGLTCTPVSSPVDGDFPTSHDCPPPTALGIGSLAIGFVLDTGTITSTAVDTPDQVNVFCGFCKNKTLNSFARKCDGSPTGANCTGNGNCTAGQSCLPVLCNPANGNNDCATATGFTSCGQRTSGAFTSTAVARTIVETGSPAGPLTTGGPPTPQTLVSIFCVPPTFSTVVDSAADLPGPGAVALEGTTQLQ